jgi:exonuclease III
VTERVCQCVHHHQVTSISSSLSPPLPLQAHHPHIICLQETKIQQTHEADFSRDPHLLPGYVKFWSSSVAKKGYAGTAIFVKRDISGGVTAAESSSSSKDTDTDRDTDRDTNRDRDISAEGHEKAGSEAGGKKGKAPPRAQQSSLSSFFRPKEPPPTTTSTTSTSSSTSTTISATAPPPPLRLLGVRSELEGGARFSGEGRTLTAEFDRFFLVNCEPPVPAAPAVPPILHFLSCHITVLCSCCALLCCLFHTTFLVMSHYCAVMCCDVLCCACAVRVLCCIMSCQPCHVTSCHCAVLYMCAVLC